MFLGHFGAGFSAKKIDQRPSLGTLFLAAQWLDLIYPILLLLGIEKVRIDPGNTAFTPLDFTYYPYTHGFLSVLIWAAMFGGIYYLVKKNTKGALLLAGLVISHWILDWIAHRPDLPLVPGLDYKVGLGLWNSVMATVMVEGFIFLVGVILYFRVTEAINWKGTWGLWGLIIFFIVIYIMNLFGPPPPGVEPIAYVGIAQWLFVAWAYWIDKNRRPRAASPLT
jgi:hypothetical protein